MGGSGALFGTGSGAASTLMPILGLAGPSEDCLFANVWTPIAAGTDLSSMPKKAVMFWIFGGGFSLGDSSTYDGSSLAASQDVVVVSANFRTNVFGFPGAPDLPDQNVGLLDQRLTLEWTRDSRRLVAIRREL